MVTFIGLILWLVVASGVILYLAGTLGIDWAQKKAWTEFAKKYKLTIERGSKKFDPITVNGVLNGRKISVYSLVEQEADERLQRRYTQIEVYLHSVPSTRFLISKKPLPPEDAARIELASVFVMNTPEWPMPAVSLVDDKAVLADWMTLPRVRALTSFMSFCEEHGAVLLAGTGDEAFLLWRGTDPLKDPRRLNAYIQKLYGFAKELDAQPIGTIAKPNAPSASISPENEA